MQKRHQNYTAFRVIVTYHHVNRLKKRVCIKHGAFDSKLDVFVKSFAHDCDDYDVYGDNGCANVVAANGDYFCVSLHHFRMLNEN